MIIESRQGKLYVDGVEQNDPTKLGKLILDNAAESYGQIRDILESNKKLVYLIDLSKECEIAVNFIYNTPVPYCLKLKQTSYPYNCIAPAKLEQLWRLIKDGDLILKEK